MSPIEDRTTVCTNHVPSTAHMPRAYSTFGFDTSSRLPPPTLPSRVALSYVRGYHQASPSPGRTSPCSLQSRGSAHDLLIHDEEKHRCQQNVVIGSSPPRVQCHVHNLWWTRLPTRSPRSQKDERNQLTLVRLQPPVSGCPRGHCLAVCS